MKILMKETNEVIDIDDIDDQHIVVAVIGDVPCMLSKDYNSGESALSFKILDSGFTRGNSLCLTDGINTIVGKIERVVIGGHPIEVFDSKDWREALKWLIDNTPK